MLTLGTWHAPSWDSWSDQHGIIMGYLISSLEMPIDGRSPDGEYDPIRGGLADMGTMAKGDPPTFRSVVAPLKNLFEARNLSPT